MLWLIVAVLAAIYLLFRFVQMTQFVLTRFFFNPAIPLPLKIACLVLLVPVAWGVRRWWRWYSNKPGPSQPRA
ncbi:MAG: hypothetical protein HY680_05165 [Chloroflexi bacterium]|nr:hypothetical protein [Chloroflexota bacterium]